MRKYVTFSIRKYVTFKRSMFSATVSTNAGNEPPDGSKGQNMYLLDPYGENSEYDIQFEALNPVEQAQYVFLQTYLRKLMLFFSKDIFGMPY